jgi:heptosyltransferase-1
MTAVLLVRLSAMGDVVQSLGAVAALHAARPELELVFCTQTTCAPLLDGVAGVAAVEPFDRGGGLRGLLDLRRRLRARAFDLALDLQGNWKSALVARLAARDSVGVGAGWRQEPPSRWLLSRTVAVPGARHPANCALAVVRALAPGAAAMLPRLSASEREVEAAAAAVRSSGLDPRQPFRLLVVGDPGDPRAQRPAALAREVAASPLPVLLLAGPSEAAVAPAVAAPLLRQRRGELRQLVGLGQLLARAGGDVVGPDLGPCHVLAATGARTTVLFGPQDPELTAPPAAVALQHRAPPACMPCRRRRCAHADGPVCMDFTAGTGLPFGAQGGSLRQP